MNEKYQETQFNPNILAATSNELSSIFSVRNNEYKPQRPPRPASLASQSNNTCQQKQIVQIPVLNQPETKLEFKTYKQIGLELPDVTQVSNNLSLAGQKFNFSPTYKDQMQIQPKLSVDDFLNKVMNDVMNDFDQVKLNFNINNRK